MSGLPLNIDIQQICLHMLNLVILVGGLYFLLYKHVRAFMDKRMRLYESREKELSLREEEALKLKAEYEERIKGAREEAAAIIAQAESLAEEILRKARAGTSDTDT